MDLSTTLMPSFFAAGGKLSLDATPVYPGFPLTNSLLMTLIVLAIVGVVIFGIGKISLIPGKVQNFMESAMEGLINLLQPILGWHVLRGTFWFFAALFLFIACANLLALLPGVGTIGFGYQQDDYFYLKYPLFRGANADVNLTLAMSLIFMVLWVYWGIYYNGLWGFILHIFGPKGDSKGILAFLMVLVFIVVGVLEVISIAIRPVALTFRLFGNIYGGEAMIHQIEYMTGGGLLGGLALIPLYMFELLVAFVQALVFLLLTAVFTGMMCKHEEGHGHGDDHGSDHEEASGPESSLEDLQKAQERAMKELAALRAGG